MTPTKKKAIEAETTRMKAHCTNHGVRCDMFNMGSYRLYKQGKVIDYYPKSKKCFWHSDNEWGAVSDIEQLIKNEFK